MLCAAHLCARFGQANSRRERKVPWVSFLGDYPSLVSLGLLVTFACRSGLNNRGGVSRDSRGGRDPTNGAECYATETRAPTKKKK